MYELPETIKSIDLVEIINDYREMEGKTKLLHKNFMAKIKNEVETLKTLGLDNELNFKPVEYVDKKGEKRPCYELSKDAMFEMLVSESVLVRYKTIQYVNKLQDRLEEYKKEITKKLTGAVPSENIKLLEYDSLTIEKVLQILKSSLSDGFIANKGEYTAILKEVVYKQLSANGLNKSKFNRFLRDNNLVKISKNGGLAYYQIRIDGKNSWHYFVRTKTLK
ncbi:hypothetical protein U728_1048 [Clostridium botulinum 202F]|nr:hypothetical protein U728_1048 [Clostridium botulinum 202F]KAI3345969.1 Rha family transcriptional regulator [Clostridium botulinum]MBY6987830.1 hypothetical protein [Clostridium botulinum]NFH02202.1 hypothetical protein [Clostridium botulinum]NFP41176.1 hypothetical protein [Clostridium botulinum]